MKSNLKWLRHRNVRRDFLDAGSPSPSPKRARVDLNLQQKLDLKADSEKVPKLTQKELGEKYGIGRATVSDILKRKDFYKTQFTDNMESSKKRFTVKFLLF